MAERREYKFRLHPATRSPDARIERRRGRNVKVQVFAPLSEDILTIFLLNQRGQIVCEMSAYKPERDIEDLLRLPERLRKRLGERGSRVQRPYLFVVNSKGDLVYQHQFESPAEIDYYTGRAIGLHSAEIDETL